MTEITKTLLRKASLRKACKELSLADLEKIQSNLAEVIEDHKAEETRRSEARKEKERKLAEIRKSMEEAGVSLEDLEAAIGSAGAQNNVKGSVSPRYQIKDADGNTHLWTGRGRAPKVFQEYFNQGGSKEDCVIR